MRGQTKRHRKQSGRVQMRNERKRLVSAIVGVLVALLIASAPLWIAPPRCEAQLIGPPADRASWLDDLDRAYAVRDSVAAHHAVFADSATAAADSMAWYVEELEYRLAASEATRVEQVDSCSVVIASQDRRIDDLKRDRGSWLYRKLTSPAVVLTTGIIIGARAVRIGAGD